MTKEELIQLAKRISDGTASDQDLIRYQTWFNYFSGHSEWDETNLGSPKDKGASLFQTITKQTIAKSSARMFRIWTSVAAAVLLLATFGVYFFRTQSVPEVQTQVALSPGEEGATLTLADGSQIRLGSAQEGQIAQQTGVSIVKSADGQLIYEFKGSANNDKQRNILSTDKGETYKIRLPDNSLVWLNASSSLTFSPSLISAGQRTVALEGEAYFEVTPDKKHPFIVTTGQQFVKVIGTRFNINSYKDEPAINTTLVDGSVQVSVQETSKVIRPNQKTVFDGNMLKVEPANIQDELDWKEGYFRFNEEPLESIMRKMARWYDIEVEYKDEAIKQLRFGGVIKRVDDASKLLELLEMTGKIKYQQQGHKIIFSKP